jgi:hypothetical protein
MGLSWAEFSRGFVRTWPFGPIDVARRLPNASMPRASGVFGPNAA